jgi:hypothetical protein
MRTVDWTVWKHKITIAAFLLYFIVSGIHPAAVNCPVSASLVGRSSHVKQSVRSNARSILRCRNLIDTKEPNRYLKFIKCGKAVKGQQEDLDLMLWDFEQCNSLQIIFGEMSLYTTVLSFVEAITVFGVKLFFYFKLQKTLPLISKSGFWTIHIFCSGASLSQYVSQNVLC